MQSLAWTLVQRWIREAANDVAVLPADAGDGPAALGALGVTDRSMLGALAVNTGGLALDHGWLRVLGGAHLLEWRDRLDTGFVVGHDVVAGFYAVDKQEGEVRYLSPDALEWMGTEMGHSEWVHWTLAGDLESFYADLRWPGWQAETVALAPGQGFRIDPPPFTREGRVIAEAAHRPAPMAELWDRQHAYIREFIGS